MYAELLELARKVGLDAGALLMERPPAFEIESKSTAIDIATQMDKKAEKFEPSYSLSDRTRSFLKIQDGCNYYCSFCTIPFARGKSRNDNIANTVTEAKKAVEKGFREIILTGVNIGDFGKSTGENFLELLKALENLKRFYGEDHTQYAKTLENLSKEMRNL